MICICLRTVVYCAGLRSVMISCTVRTVQAPRLHRMVRISSSASVGLGGSSGIYEDFNTNVVVCQAVLQGIFGETARRAPAAVARFSELYTRPMPRRILITVGA